MIRLNDGQGGFLPTEIDVPLGAGGGGPTSLVTGQFNGAGTPLDVAVVNNFAANVMILTDFNGNGFDSMATVAVGAEPIDVAAGIITGDSGHLDLVVVNQADNTIQALLNNSGGGFVAAAPIGTGGLAAVSIVVGPFSDDGFLDVAVAHTSPHDASTPFGDVRMLVGDGAGGFTLTPQRYEVGQLPIDMVAADFDGDPGGKIDLAVTNFSSNSLTILTGNADGTFTVQPQTLGTSSGAFDIAAADIDGDGDVDLVASNLLDRNVSIFRNLTTAPGQTDFRPLEGVGLGQFSLAQRMPLVLADFDQDGSGPGGQNTVDIVAIPRQTDTLHVLRNTLINGAHRVELSGVNQVSGLDFVIKPAAIPPALDPIADPAAVVEDAGEQIIGLTGIAAGRAGGPALQVNASSGNANLIPDPAITYAEGSSTATLRFTPVANANGTAEITVRVLDAGANAIFGDGDDTTAERTFVVTVLPVNDPPTFDTGGTVTVTQKQGAVSMPGFISNMLPGGGADESPQTVIVLTASTDSAGLFSTPPAIDSQGHLTFVPHPDRSGLAIVETRLTDSGGVDHGGRDWSTRPFVINILPVNDAPSINIGGDMTVSADAGPQAVSAFATGFDPGAGDDDAGQTLSEFDVSTDHPEWFSDPPSIDVAGTLAFTPLPTASGVATVTVRVRDDGGRCQRWRGSFGGKDGSDHDQRAQPNGGVDRIWIRAGAEVGDQQCDRDVRPGGHRGRRRVLSAQAWRWRWAGRIAQFARGRRQR